MKKRIIAVFLAVVLGFAAFTASVPVFASASYLGPVVWENIFLIILDYIFDIEKILDDSKDKLTYALNPDKYWFEQRCKIIAKLQPQIEDFPRSEFERFYELFNERDFDSIETRYGKLVRDKCEIDETTVQNFYLHTFFAFDGFDDFLDYLYDFSDDYTLDDKGNPQIPVEDFKEEIEKQNQTITPKNRNMHKYSWRELSNTQKDYSAFFLCRLLGNNGKFLENTFDQGIYIQPYYRLNSSLPTSGSSIPPTGGDYYYPYQIHLYRETIVGDSLEGSSGEHYPNYTYNWYADFLHYMIVGDERLDSYKQKLCTASSYINSSGVYQPNEVRYINFGFGYSGKEFFFDTYKSLSDAFSTPLSTAVNDIVVPPINIYNCSALFSELHSSYLLSSNVNTRIDFTGYLRGYFSSGVYGSSSGSVTKTTLDQFNALQAEQGYSDTVSDYGFYVSVEPFSTTYMFDVTKLPTNATITISGDSVYDYSITDNSTGETSTIYNYVNNNYTYPENSGNQGGGNQGGGNQGGGNVGGNITVGGQVDVGGKVDVNVNINGGNGVSVDMPDMNPVDDYLNNALDESTGIRKFLKQFFDFLPVEIVTLLGILIAVCIVARLLGR